MQSRRLLVIRHAKAASAAATDADRPLSEQGARDAEALGRWLAEQVDPPDAAVVSSAVRAQQTWEGVARGAGWSLTADSSPALYAAEPETALDLVREADPQTRVVALVGHNPTVGTMAQLLDDGEGDAAAGADLVAGGYPPGAVAVFDHDGEWAELAWGTARLVAYRG